MNEYMNERMTLRYLVSVGSASSRLLGNLHPPASNTFHNEYVSEETEVLVFIQEKSEICLYEAPSSQ